MDSRNCKAALAKFVTARGARSTLKGECYLRDLSRLIPAASGYRGAADLAEWLTETAGRRVYAGRVVVGLGADPAIFSSLALFNIRHVFEAVGAGAAEDSKNEHSQTLQRFWEGARAAAEKAQIMKSVLLMIEKERPDTVKQYQRTNDPVWAPYFRHFTPKR